MDLYKIMNSRTVTKTVQNYYNKLSTYGKMEFNAYRLDKGLPRVTTKKYTSRKRKPKMGMVTKKITVAIMVPTSKPRRKRRTRRTSTSLW